MNSDGCEENIMTLLTTLVSQTDEFLKGKDMVTSG
eukprot:CAMPEP_0205825668 /NCGR_PEP_ID=MMETSP0206-20130828/26067_1 /ASSEMBLY_ACC=CAM_ASM_000279 /TAXON_ID=36767 /ORGANISM="Euplotes focardii, Strain TN1" /LENGTH=34 /DNA_ID= /DNA_START= /DNA_END= /DNA_ORIENTATION=